MVTYAQTAEELEVFNNLNNYRVSLGLNKLTLDSEISYICYKHNEFMIYNNRFTHEGFEKRVFAIKNKKVTAENLSKNSTNPITSWKNSEYHRENMEGDYDRCGISCKEGYVTLIIVKNER
jgi:uncharacterized protein YkwD